MIATTRQILKKEDGFVLLVVVMMLVVVTVIGIAANRTSDTEMRIAANEKWRTDEFYAAEGGLIDTIERSADWLTDDFLTAGEDAAAYTTTLDFGSGPHDVNSTTVEIRCIENSGVEIDGLSAAANDIPLQAHIGGPPEGSGYSYDFVIRRYAVTSTSTNGNTQLQFGVWKVFNNF